MKTNSVEETKEKDMSTNNETNSEWSGYCDPCDPSNYWIDDDTGERVDAISGERSEHSCPEE